MSDRIPRPPKSFWTADCETDPFDGVTIPKPFIWGLYNGYTGEYYEFDTPAAFIKFVKKQEIIVYAHNGGKFDWHFITPFMVDGCEPLLINGRMSKFIIGKCEFRDSFNLIAQPLRNSLKDEFDYMKMNADVRHLYMDEIRVYLKSDCVNLWEVLQQFRETYGLHLTQAGAAMQIWQRDFYDKSPAANKHWRQKKIDFDRLRPFYYGGRVQCFKAGDFERRAMSVDINSAYPDAMMRQHAFGRPIYRAKGPPPERMGDWSQFFFTVRCVARGCFPYKDTRKRTYYPADDVKRTYKITGWELLAAIETSTIEDWKIVDWIGCETSIDFVGYINYFWDERAGHKAALKIDPLNHVANWKQQFCKIFMNALYGKFGADIERYKRHFFYSAKSFKKIKAEGLPDGADFFSFREWVILRTPKDTTREQRYYHVGTAASITGFVRAKLWRAICKANTPYYCDTDSICAASFPKGSIELGPELGQWEIEGKYDRIAIGGKKLYAYRYAKRNDDGSEHWKYRSKGVRIDAQEILRVVAGEAVSYNPQAPSFKIRGDGPEFVSRLVKSTARDATTIPRELDPEFK